jgi:hypothetical protein
MPNQVLNHPPSRTDLRLSLPELDIAIAAAIDVAKIVGGAKGSNSRDYRTATNILSEMQSEVACRRGQPQLSS